MQLDIGRLVLEDLEDLRPEEACLKAVTEILGVPHHVYFIAVTAGPEEEEGNEQIAVHDPYGRLDDMRRLNEGRLFTVRVPGFEGEYLTVLFPFAD